MKYVSIGIKEFAKIIFAVIIAQETSRAALYVLTNTIFYLANATEQINHHVDISYVKHRHNEMNGSKMARARSHILTTGLTNLRLGCNSQTCVHDSYLSRLLIILKSPKA